MQAPQKPHLMMSVTNMTQRTRIFVDRSCRYPERIRSSSEQKGVWDHSLGGQPAPHVDANCRQCVEKWVLFEKSELSLAFEQAPMPEDAIACVLNGLHLAYAAFAFAPLAFGW